MDWQGEEKNRTEDANATADIFIDNKLFQASLAKFAVYLENDFKIIFKLIES